MKQTRKVLTQIKKLEEDDINTLKKRIDIATLVIIAFLAILIARLWFLQVRNGAEYEQLANNNRVRMRDVVAPRGNIYDTDNRLLVTNRPSFNIVWTKEDAPEPEKIIKRLAAILNEDITVILGRVREAADNPRHIPIRLKEDIDWDVLAYIENNRYDLPGVSIEVLPRRKYLYNSIASHSIGYLGEINKQELANRPNENYQVGDQIGKTGIEKLFEIPLRGEKGQLYVEVDAHGFEQKRLPGLKPLPGNDIRLTLDLDLQQTAHKALAGRAGAVVVMEVNSGRILTLTSSPTINLEEFLGGISTTAWNKLLNDPLHPLVNKAIMGQYPPGSTYKIVTALAGLTENIITPETEFYCSGSLKFGNRHYGCWKRSGHGPTVLHKALRESCDVYFYMVGQKLGVDTLARYANSLGLGLKTGIELEHEKNGLVPTSEWKRRKIKETWQKGETLSVAIGQGFNLTTPLQICLMTATLANGGTLYRPQLIETISDPEGDILKTLHPISKGYALGSQNSFKLIKKGLIAAVNDKKHGTGNEASMENVIVAGKTGTAQVIRLARFKDMPEEEIPYQYRDHAWFTCFAPAEEPEIAVTVLVEHGQHGGSTAGPVAKAVMTKYFEKNDTI
jgi:penicillin-binding protein 2